LDVTIAPSRSTGSSSSNNNNSSSQERSNSSSSTASGSNPNNNSSTNSIGNSLQEEAIYKAERDVREDVRFLLRAIEQRDNVLSASRRAFQKLHRECKKVAQLTLYKISEREFENAETRWAVLQKLQSSVAAIDLDYDENEFISTHCGSEGALVLSSQALSLLGDLATQAAVGTAGDSAGLADYDGSGGGGGGTSNTGYAVGSSSNNSSSISNSNRSPPRSPIVNNKKEKSFLTRNLFNRTLGLVSSGNSAASSSSRSSAAAAAAANAAPGVSGASPAPGASKASLQSRPLPDTPAAQAAAAESAASALQDKEELTAHLSKLFYTSSSSGGVVGSSSFSSSSSLDAAAAQSDSPSCGPSWTSAPQPGGKDLQSSDAAAGASTNTGTSRPSKIALASFATDTISNETARSDQSSAPDPEQDSEHVLIDDNYFKGNDGGTPRTDEAEGDVAAAGGGELAGNLTSTKHVERLSFTEYPPTIDDVSPEGDGGRDGGRGGDQAAKGGGLGLALPVRRSSGGGSSSRRRGSRPTAADPRPQQEVQQQPFQPNLSAAEWLARNSSQSELAVAVEGIVSKVHSHSGRAAFMTELNKFRSKKVKHVVMC
jgi:hypothetical protein